MQSSQVPDAIALRGGSESDQITTRLGNPKPLRVETKNITPEGEGPDPGHAACQVRTAPVPTVQILRSLEEDFVGALQILLAGLSVVKMGHGPYRQVS